MHCRLFDWDTDLLALHLPQDLNLPDPKAVVWPLHFQLYDANVWVRKLTGQPPHVTSLHIHL